MTDDRACIVTPCGGVAPRGAPVRASPLATRSPVRVWPSRATPPRHIYVQWPVGHFPVPSADRCWPGGRPPARPGLPSRSPPTAFFPPRSAWLAHGPAPARAAGWVPSAPLSLFRFNFLSPRPARCRVPSRTPRAADSPMAQLFLEADVSAQAPLTPAPRPPTTPASRLTLGSRLPGFPRVPGSPRPEADAISVCDFCCYNDRFCTR